MSTLLSSAFIFKMSSSFDSAAVFCLGVEGEAGGGDELSSCVSGDDVDGGVQLDFFEDLGVNISLIFVLFCFFLQPRKRALCHHLSVTKKNRHTCNI